MRLTDFARMPVLKYRISFCFQEFSLVFQMRAGVLQHYLSIFVKGC